MFWFEDLIFRLVVFLVFCLLTALVVGVIYFGYLTHLHHTNIEKWCELKNTADYLTPKGCEKYL